ncbi:phosphatidylserine decarboxylase [Paenibacillus sp. FSL H8-0548]|uniref:archaetidylserine decarboxylase n=1 Tax=Paenibacillus sp. FSL H8-0548 TaxID=1920422 RepID=UPI00096FA4F5|nr:archaetidylserine decarboxylase [Paenibacillus sp. FSL H8-0548]OMF35920.1 phosphatidylserine decarboxylase [Paenibacillus sp. FSL H8-0548]
MTKWLLRSMTELSSRKWISSMTGRFAQSAASRPFISHFAKTYKIKTEEAEKPLSQYHTLNEFFTRRLKTGLREIHSDADSLVSPVDALITGAGPINQGTLVNVKGQDYTIDELLNRSPRASNYLNGYYIVLYLSPTDYHRIHTPVSGHIVEREHIAGKVYPVNDFGLRHMRRVLSRNERLITYMQHSEGEAAVVKVGAMNVSSIQYVQPLKSTMSKGEELAYFEFGSTVVLVLEDKTFTPRDNNLLGSKVQMGELLGSLRSR